MHLKKQTDNEYQVIFLPDNGKSRSMEDKSKTTKTGYDKAVAWGTSGKGEIE